MSRLVHVQAMVLAVAIAIPGAARTSGFQTDALPQSAAQGPPKPAPPQQPPARVAETVEVVATKVPEAPHEVPASIEVISGSDLRNMGARTLREAMALAAGVEVAPGSDGGPASSVPEFWGLREFDAFLLVVDGIPWGGAFNPALASLSLRDVERIEVLRGAAPVTYGATSFVGVIHIVHKTAAAEHSYASGDLGTRSSGSLGVDLAVPTTGGWQSRLSAEFAEQGFKDPRTNYGRGHAMWRSARIQSDRRMWFTADLDFLRQDPASPHPRQGSGLSTNVPLDANYNPEGAFLDSNRFAFIFGMERPMGQSLRYGTTLSFTHTGQELFRGFLTAIADAPENATGLRETIDQNDIYGDMHVIWPERRHVRLIVGGDYLHGNGEGKGATFDYTVPLGGSPATVVPEPTTLDIRSEDRREFIGGYTLLEWKPTSRLSVSGGLRLNVTFEEGGEGESEPAPGETEKGQTHVRPSGSVGAIYSVWERGVEHVRVFGNYRNTFKPAAFDFGLGEGEAEGERGLLEPETAWSIEGGVKIRTLEGRLDLEASAFRLDFSNLVTSTVINGLPALQNTGKTRFQGFELAADVRLEHAINGRFTYSFHDGTFVDFVQSFDGVPTQLAGNRFEMSPRHLLSAGVVLAPDSGFVADAIVKYTGDRYLNKRNTALAEPFTAIDLGAGYRFGNYEARVDAHNISDRRDPVSESELGDAQYYRLFAREVKASLGFRF